MQHFIHAQKFTGAQLHSGSRTHARPRTRLPFTLGALGAAALAAIGLTLSAAAPALAHDELIGQDFTVNADGETDAIVLQYNNNIMDVGTEIRATDPNGNDVANGDPFVEGRDVTQPLAAPLAAGGPYEIAWRVVSSDGHPIQGLISFEITEDGTAAIVEADDGAHDDDSHDHSHDADDHSHEGDDHAHDGETEGDSASQEQSAGLHPAVIVAISVVGLAAIIAIVAAVSRGKRNQQAEQVGASGAGAGAGASTDADAGADGENGGKL